MWLWMALLLAAAFGLARWRGGSDLPDAAARAVLGLFALLLVSSFVVDALRNRRRSQRLPTHTQNLRR